MKRVLILGDGYLQSTVIKAAKNLGCYIIGCDMVKGNYGEQYLDEFYNISTTDMEGVLALAKRLKIDGILTYASDVSALTVSYVAEKLGLPCNPFNTVNIMTHKDLFHPFLKQKGFNIPRSAIIHSLQELYDYFDNGAADILVKPVRASGSKGVTRVNNRENLESAYLEAKKYARENECLVAEDFIQRKGYQIAGDAFVVNGRIAFFGLADEHFDKMSNPLVPIGESFPSSISDDNRRKAFAVIQNALSELGYKNGAVNLDFMFDQNGEVFIIELGPRNGGNLITDAIKMSCGVDLAEYTVKAALGENMDDLHEKTMQKCVSSYVWHSSENGKFKELVIKPELQEKIELLKLLISPGDEVQKYNNGSFGIGFSLISFEDMKQMNDVIDNMENYHKVVVG